MSVDISKVKAKVQEHHDETGAPNRHGWFRSDIQYQKASNGCMAGFQFDMKTIANADEAVSWIVFHGDGVDISFDGLRDVVQFNKELAESKHSNTQFYPTERSKRWVEFLMSDKSPWKELHPYIIEQDADFLNKAGFIFRHDIPRKLAYNFAMAVRFPWELPRQYSLWLNLVDKMGLEEKVALYVATNFELTTAANDYEGPYELVYPWSFLESSEPVAISRFVQAMPNMAGSDVTSPNVKPLWDATDASIIEASKKVYSEWCAVNSMPLSKIVADIQRCI